MRPSVLRLTSGAIGTSSTATEDLRMWRAGERQVSAGRSLEREVLVATKRWNGST